MDENKTYAQMKKEFREKFQNEIVPKIKGFDTERKSRKQNLLNKRKKYVKIAVIFLLCISIGTYFKTGSILSVLLISGQLSIWALVFFPWIDTGFESKIKAVVMPIICECFEDLQWSIREKINGKFLQEANLLGYYSRESYDDIFRGSYHGVNFEIAEARYERRKGTAFWGTIVILDMNKNFDANTLIIHKQAEINPEILLFKRAKMEDPKFEKEYGVFTENELEARYLITPTFIERLNNIKFAFDAYKISCSFYKNHLIFAIDTPDLFKLGSLDIPVYNFKQYEKLFDEIISIMQLIDHFKLNQRIGL